MKTLIVARNVFRRLKHDLLTVLMIGTIPLLFILLFGYAFSGNPSDIRMIIVNQDTGRVTVRTAELGRIQVNRMVSTELIEGFGERTFRVRYLDDPEEAERELKAGRAWAVIHFKPNFSQRFVDKVLTIRGGMAYSYGGQTVHLLAPESPAGRLPLQLLIDRSNVPVAQTIVATVERSLNRVLFAYLGEGTKGGTANEPLDVEYVYAPEADLLDYYSPGVIGFAVTVITSMLTLISLVREERNDILERLLTFPIRPWQLSLGYTLAFTVIALIQALEVILIAYLLFRTMFAGSLLLMLFVIVVYTVGLQGMGTLLSGLARNEFQAVQYALLIIIPGLILTEAFWPIEALTPALRPLAYMIPLTYLNRALRAIMLRGWGLKGIAVDLGILAAFAAIMLGLSIGLMRRRAYRS